uniref:Uncharacterized protein n=1 Tax=Anguilla anguilla TaxID=7936 RepID=A0A0E9VIJ0_ANGAN
MACEIMISCCECCLVDCRELFQLNIQRSDVCVACSS